MKAFFHNGTGRRMNSSDRHLSAGYAVNFARDITGLIAGKEHENWGYLGRLSGTPEEGIGTEMRHLFFG